MVSWIWFVVAAIVLIVVAGAVWLFARRHRSGRLRARFGPEYERTVREHGRREAETELEKREQRVKALDIRPLAGEDRDRYAASWRHLQARFVDDPIVTITEAHVLVGEVMSARGYPVGDFEQQAANVSVNHPSVVENYRAAHAIALRHSRGEASTEDLRQAMVHYRALFEELLGERVRVAGRTEIEQ